MAGSSAGVPVRGPGPQISPLHNSKEKHAAATTCVQDDLRGWCRKPCVLQLAEKNDVATPQKYAMGPTLSLHPVGTERRSKTNGPSGRLS